MDQYYESENIICKSSITIYDVKLNSTFDAIIATFQPDLHLPPMEMVKEYNKLYTTDSVKQRSYYFLFVWIRWVSQIIC